MSAANPWEHRARSVKAFKISRILVRTCRDTGFDPARLADANEIERARAARIANVPYPSEATWAEAVALTEATLG